IFDVPLSIDAEDLHRHLVAEPIGVDDRDRIPELEARVACNGDVIGGRKRLFNSPHDPFDDRVMPVRVWHHGGVVVPVALQLQVPSAVLHHGLATPREYGDLAIVFDVRPTDVVRGLLATHVSVALGIGVGVLRVVRELCGSGAHRAAPATAHADSQEAIASEVLVNDEPAFPRTVLFPTASGIAPEGDHISVMDLVGIPDVPTAGSGTFPSPLVRLVVVMAETERDGGQDVVDPDLLFDPASGWDDKLLKVARRPHVAKHRTLAGRLNGD